MFMSNFINPYDRESGRMEKILGITILGSIAVHVLICWVFLFFLPSLHSGRLPRVDNVIVVELIGSLAPPAPAAPSKLPVNPDRKGPDIVEAPKSESLPTPQPQFTPSQPEAVAAPTDVIPLGPKAPEKPPEIKKTQAPPPKPQVPKVEPKKPPAKPPVNRNLDADIDKRLAALERKVAAENIDDEIDSRMMNLAATQGAGRGEGSESGGATQGARIHPEKQRYYNHIRDIVSSNWVPPSGTSSATTADLQIKIEPNGTISDIRVRQASGNQDFDLSVERAIKKSSPFPPLPPIFEGMADSPTMRFNDKDLRSGLTS